HSKSSWQERLVLALFVVSAAGLGYLGMRLQLWQAAILWAGYFVALAVCSRPGWVQLFGPVLFYDMVRTARRSRYILMRLLYANLLLAILCSMFFSREVHLRAHQREIAVLAESFFSVFMIVQIVLVAVMTPAYVAGAIAEEKDRKTLEFMLATDLTNREIILSKLLSRLANLTLFLLTGLPILSLIQFLGGVDPNLVLAGFVATLMTMLGLG